MEADPPRIHCRFGTLVRVLAIDYHTIDQPLRRLIHEHCLTPVLCLLPNKIYLAESYWSP
jgi:hypothetical protein